MATLKEYYNKDLSTLLSQHKIWKLSSPNGIIYEVTSRLHLDFNAHVTFISFYVPLIENPIDAFSLLLSKIEDVLDIKKGIEVAKGGFGQEKDHSSELRFSGKVFFYFEGEVNKTEFEFLQQKVKTNGLILRFRDQNYVNEKNKIEKPLAFISHDTRDKEFIAGPLALALQKRMCWVWYDQYSLKIGDSLRESIERGIINCNKCVLILSPNFIKNNGWTKIEFNAIFTREIIETKNLILPIWAGVSKKEVYEYSPTLSERFGIDWDLGVEIVANKIHKAVIK
ncbi:MAG: toll/interleukin-1 receptor domain-containing protein [Sphingobacteriaceae bacterium]|nr:toll/interleukin-1 receptor domain-containing protein [Sphingobacteriaceae bacterium]